MTERELHCENAEEPIAVMLSGMEILFRLEQPIKV
jgi:hypothetical protein